MNGYCRRLEYRATGVFLTRGRRKSRARAYTDYQERYVSSNSAEGSGEAHIELDPRGTD